MRLAKQTLPYVMAVTIVGLLLWQIEPLQVVRLLAGADVTWLLAGFGAYVFTNIVRACRFGILLPWPPQGPAHDTCSVYSQHQYSAQSPNHTSAPRALSPAHFLASLRLLPEVFVLSLLNNTLPSRGGELSFPYFMRQRHGMPAGESTAALVVARIFDYLAVALLYVLFALLNLQRLAPAATTIVLAVAAALLLSLVILAATPWLGRQGFRAAEWVLWRLRLDRHPIGQLLLRGGQRTVTSFQRMHTFRTYALTMSWSLLTWLGTFAWFAAFMRAIGLPQPYALVIVGGTFAILAKALPFITLGGFGAHEAGWALGFSLTGMSTDLAIASGFVINILTLLASVIFGGLALGYMRWERPRRLAGPAVGPSGQKAG